MPDFTKRVEEIDTKDLLDAIYGEIQSITERGGADNLIYHYFLPPVPFGPELASFMDLGGRPRKLENTDEAGEVRYTVADMQRAAVNFAVLADFIPTIGSDPIVAPDDTEPVDLNSLIVSGKRVSDIYNTVLANCKVVDNAMTDEDRAKIEKLERLLYKEPKKVSEEPDEDELLESVEADEEEDIDLDALLGEDGADAGDFVESPDQLREPTKLMKVYRALENKYYQVEHTALKEAEEISNDDPNRGRRIRALQARIRSAKRQWEVQGKKKQVEAIMAKIAVMSRGGMPEYLKGLQERFEANQLTASVFTGEEGGAGLLTEDARYTALRPNGILNAPSLMKVTLKSTDIEKWHKTTQSKSSGSLKIPVYSLFGKASGSREKSSVDDSFFKKEFEISFELVQGVIDRPWLDVAFLESSAYTTVDPQSKEALDAIHEITLLSDGEQPPSAGLMPAIPMSAYFARNMVVRSEALATMDSDEKRKFEGKAGMSFLGFGAKGEHMNETHTVRFGERGASGEMVIEGQFLVGLASRFLPRAPDPDFESHPNADDWV